MRSIDDIFKEIKSTGLDVTFSGGDPLYQPYGFAKLAEKIKKELGRNIWCYTGFRYEQLKNIVFADQLLKYIDVLVDGPFIQDMKSDNLLFRGSSNQRLIDVPKSLESGRVVLYEYDPYPRFY